MANSNAELPQMMVEMFVHQNCPLLRFEWTEEGMRMAGAADSALASEAIDCCKEPGPLSLKVAGRQVCGKELW